MKFTSKNQDSSQQDQAGDDEVAEPSNAVDEGTEIPGGEHHDCGCDVCAERGDMLEKMQVEKPGVPGGGERPTHGGPGLMIVLGGGGPGGEGSGPRRKNLMDELMRKKA